jgi:hypothetical protein
LEFGNRELDYYSKSTALYPTCFLAFGATSDDMSVYVSPASCTPIYVDYLRKVAVPYLDYYVNETTLDITYMAQGASVTIPTGCVARDGTVAGAAATSLTQNWEWHDHDIPQIVNLILEVVGVQLPDELLIQDSAKNLPIIEKA